MYASPEPKMCMLAKSDVVPYCLARQGLPRALPAVKPIAAVPLADDVMKLLNRSDRNASCVQQSSENVIPDQQFRDIISEQDNSQQP